MEDKINKDRIKDNSSTGSNLEDLIPFFLFTSRGYGKTHFSSEMFEQSESIEDIEHEVIEFKPLPNG